MTKTPSLLPNSKIFQTESTTLAVSYKLLRDSSVTGVHSPLCGSIGPHAFNLEEENNINFKLLILINMR